MIKTNNYQKAASVFLWVGNKFYLSRILKKSYFKGLWCNPGGKVEKNESIISAIQRETLEEVGLWLPRVSFELKDCYIYDKSKLKSFTYNVVLGEWGVSQSEVKNLEPTKHSDWQLFSIEEALKLKLIPSVRNYLLSLKR